MAAMVDTSLYAAFLIAAFALCITPGPDMMFIVAMGGRGGPMTGVTAALGVACAMFVHSVAAALGLSALFLTLPGRGGGRGAAPGFWRGAVTNLLNPKVILFNVSVLPQFVNPELGHAREQFLALGVTITLMGLLVDGSVGLLSGKLSAPAVRLAAAPK